MEDCLTGMERIEDGSIDMILTDLPYGTTQCKWDTVIPLQDYIVTEEKKKWIRMTEEKYLMAAYKKGIPYKEAVNYFKEQKHPGLWSHYERVIKKHGAILLFSQTPFTEVLGASNQKLLRYEWIWEKTNATGHLNANRMPMKAHENVLVFYKKIPVYHPQKTQGHPPVHTFTKTVTSQNKTEVYGITKHEISGGGDTSRYPRSVILYSSDKQKSAVHSTQKPLELMEYFIKTYTDPGNIVLDSCMGSFTTAIAARKNGRNFIGFENNQDIYQDGLIRYKTYFGEY